MSHLPLENVRVAQVMYTRSSPRVDILHGMQNLRRFSYAGVTLTAEALLQTLALISTPMSRRIPDPDLFPSLDELHLSNIYTTLEAGPSFESFCNLLWSVLADRKERGRPISKVVLHQFPVLSAANVQQLQEVVDVLEQQVSE